MCLTCVFAILKSGSHERVTESLRIDYFRKCNERLNNVPLHGPPSYNTFSVITFATFEQPRHDPLLIALQEQTISELASSREQEGDACRAARASLSKERSALAESERRARETKREAQYASSPPESVNANEEVPSILREQVTNPSGDSHSARANGGKHSSQCDGDDIPSQRAGNRWEEHVYQQTGRMGISQTPHMVASTTARDGTRGPPMEAVANSALECGKGTREAKERDKTREVVFSLEEALHVAREEVGHLKRRVSHLRVQLREAERRGYEMEAIAAAARATATTAEATMGTAITEAENATTERREAEKRAVDAERCESKRVKVFEEELSQAMAAAREAKEACSVSLEEVVRLRDALQESDRRATVFEKYLITSTANLRAAEAGRARALMEMVVGRGSDRLDRGSENGDPSICPGTVREGPVVKGRSTAFASEGQYGFQAIGKGMDRRWPVLLPNVIREDCSTRPFEGEAVHGVESRSGNSDNDKSSTDESHYEIAVMQERLAASQAHHQDLVQASQRAVARCQEHCDVRVQAALAAGKLSAACWRRRGVIAGRESVLEASSRLALVRRCFRALREEALCRSRDRSVRRQDMIQRWIGSAVARAGEEIGSMATRNKPLSDEGE